MGERKVEVVVMVRAVLYHRGVARSEGDILEMRECDARRLEEQGVVSRVTEAAPAIAEAPPVDDLLEPSGHGLHTVRGVIFGLFGALPLDLGIAFALLSL